MSTQIRIESVLWIIVDDIRKIFLAFDLDPQNITYLSVITLAYDRQHPVLFVQMYSHFRLKDQLKCIIFKYVSCWNCA